MLKSTFCRQSSTLKSTLRHRLSMPKRTLNFLNPYSLSLSLLLSLSLSLLLSLPPDLFSLSGSSTSNGFGGSIDLAAILDFVDSGHDLILATDASASNLIREVAIECGVDFDENPAAVVIDHTSYAVSDTEGDHTLIASDDFIQSDVILGREKIEDWRSKYAGSWCFAWLAGLVGSG